MITLKPYRQEDHLISDDIRESGGFYFLRRVIRKKAGILKCVKEIEVISKKRTIKRKIKGYSGFI